MNEVKRARQPMVLQLLAEGVCKPREAAHLHAHREVLSLGVARRNVALFGIAGDDLLDRADDFAWAVASLCGRVAVDFDHRCVVDRFPRPSGFYGDQISPVPVCGQLDAVGESLGQIKEEAVAGLSVTIADTPSWDELSLRVDSNPRPRIAGMLQDRALLVLLLAADEAPNFVALDTLTLQVAEDAIREPLARLANLHSKACNGLLGNASDADGGTLGAAFHQARNHSRSVGVAQAVHGTSNCFPSASKYAKSSKPPLSHLGQRHSIREVPTGSDLSLETLRARLHLRQTSETFFISVPFRLRRLRSWLFATTEATLALVRFLQRQRRRGMLRPGALAASRFHHSACTG